MITATQFIPLLAATRPAPLSEAELVSRHAVLATGLLLLFLAGLTADAYLLLRWAQRQRPTGVAPKPWGLRDLAAISIVLLVSVILLIVIGFFLPHSVFATLAVEMGVRVALLLALAVFFRQRRISLPAAFGLSAATPGAAFASGGLLFFAAVPPLIGVYTLSERLCHAAGIPITPQPITDLFVTTNSTSVLALLVSFAVLVAPVFEEVLFRGLAYPALKQRLGPTRALLLVSAAFALVHFHAPSVGPLFALALALGFAYEYTGSLLTPIAMHALFNATNILALLYARTHP